MLDLSEPRSFGQIIRTSWALYQEYFDVLVPIAALLIPLQFLSEFGFLWGPIFYDLLLWVWATMLGGALIFAANEALQGRQPQFGESIQAARARIGPLLTTALLRGVLAIAALFAYPYFYVRWALSDQVVMLEEKRNWAAMDASSALVRDQWWRVCAILLALNAMTLLSIIVGILLAFSGGDMRAALLGFDIVSAAVLPLTTVAAVLLYHDLRARHPYLPEDPRSALGPAPAR